jgi:hypothetical protein
MIYSLKKFRHYLPGSHFNFFTEHSALKYLVNKLVLEGRICTCLLIFQEFSFKVIFKPGICNVGMDHLSILESGESGGALDDQLSDVDIFQIEAIPKYVEDIFPFLSLGTCLENYFATPKWNLVVRETEFQLIAGQIYNMGLDIILKRCVLTHERKYILWECHNGVVGGHIGGKYSTHKILQVGLWWPTLFKDSKSYVISYDIFQRVGKPSRSITSPFG